MKVIIEVSGGVVQEVFCDDPVLNVVLVDWDTEGCSLNEHGIVVVRDEEGREHLARAYECQTTPINQMPPETQVAVKSAS